MTIDYVPSPTSSDESLPDRWTWDELNRVSDLLLAVYPRWEDLRFPATAINPPGQASDPDIDTTYGFFLFALNELIFLQVQLPHAWKVGSTIRPHVHWMKTTAAAGLVNWQLDYRWAKIGEVMDGSWTTLSSETPSVSDGDTQYQHAITELGDISDSSGDISDMLVMKLTRVAASANEYGTDAALLEFDIHYEVDNVGSDKEFIKT